jgi:CHAT domain-containing protein
MAELLVYENLDLLFKGNGDGYRVRVTHAPGGADVPEQTFDVPFDDRDLENFVLRLGRSRGNVRRIDSPEVQGTKDIGGSLFRALFSRNLATCLAKSLDRCQQAGQGLRLRLNLTEAPALLNLPWEFLYDQSTNRFLSLSDETPIVRYLAVDHPANPLRTPLPLRVLVMVSNPDDDEYQDLDVEKETADLKKAVASLEGRGHLFLEFIPAKLPDLTRALRGNSYHVFHFIGHGGFDQGSRDGALVLEGDGGRASLTSGQVLGTFLSDHRPLRLAVLNACEGGRSANDDPFAGVAQTLIQQGVPAVVAMQFEITDRAAIAFSDDFYASLVLGLPVDVAVNEARKSIYAQPNATEWATPVLYLRSPDGVLFDLESAPVLPEQRATDSDGTVSEGTQLAAAADRGVAITAESESESDRDAPVAPARHSQTGAPISEDARFTIQPTTRDIYEAPQSQSILEPLRRTPTLLLLGFAMLAFGLFWYFQARYFDTTNPQNLTAGDYARPFGWALSAAAAYLGASLVGRSASGASYNRGLLVLGGVFLTVAALGSLTFAIAKHGSQDPTFLNISLGLEVVGILLVGFLCFVLATRFRTSRMGPRGRSPAGPLVLAGVGIWLYSLAKYPAFTWVTTDQYTNVSHVCIVIASVGLITLSGALVLTGIYRAGPVVRLLIAALALLILALADIVYAYSLTQNAQIDSASVICSSYICLAIVFFVSPFLTRPSRRDANGERKLIARA